MEFTLLAAALIAAGGTAVGVRMAPAADRSSLGGALVNGLIAGLLGGRVVAMIAAGVNPITSPLDLIILRGGVAPAGAALAAIGAVAASLRGDRRRLDLTAPAALLGLASWHASCIVRDSCLGTATGLPWGLSAAGGTVPRHPVEIYAAILLVAAALAIGRLRRPPGAAALVSVTAVAAIRAATEPLRVTLGGTLGIYLVGFTLSLILLLTLLARSSSGDGSTAEGQEPQGE